MDDYDIYGDLTEGKQPEEAVLQFVDTGTSYDELAKNLREKTEEVSSLIGKLLELENQNKKLKNTNEILLRNMSILLKTAQEEVKRKTNEILSLRKGVDNG